MKRKIVIITISYIVGLIWGLYFYNIASFLIFFMALIFMLLKKKKFGFFLIMIMLISCLYIKNEENKYQIKYENIDEIKIEGIVVNDYKETEYSKKYIINVTNSNSEKNIKNTKLIINVKKGKNVSNLEFGDKIIINGNFEKGEIQRNYKGYNYNNYLKTKKIYGTVKVDNINVVDKNCSSKYELILHKIFENLEKKIYSFLPEKSADMCMALILGNKSNIDSNIIDDFSDCNLSHILAISGMHMTYIISIFSYILIFCGKSKRNIIMIFLVFIFCNLVGNGESILRATIMTALYIFANIINRKSDSINNLAISALVILIINPYSILGLSFMLSFGGTLGIIIFNKYILRMLNYLKFFDKNKLTIYIKNSISMSISANIIITPIIILYFHKISLIFILSNILANILLSVIMPLIFVCIILAFISIKLSSVMGYILNFFINLLIYMTNFLSSKMQLSVLVCRPYFISIVAYYIIFILWLKKFKSNKSKKKFINKIIKITFIIYLSICVILNIINKFDSNMYIYFVDVGQGDCTFITTKLNKKIIIDGGGSELGDDYVGKNTLLPYLLNRRARKIDYMFISHFDSDHCKALLYIMQNIDIKNIIIGTQYETSENYKEFVEIVKERKISVKVVQKGERIVIEKDLYIEILWPSSSNMISENSINNNSLVFKLIYKNFSMLFTGDIEEIAEKKILNLYDNNVLNSTVLKVAHHGSKTSSIKEFLDKVKPKYAVIGVGKDNKYGHPSDITISNLEAMNTKIYRTDEMGEITIITDGKKLKIKEYIKY